MACSKGEKILIEQLCTIAGVSKVVATNLLEACGNNLEMAVNMHMEGMDTEPTAGTSQAYSCSSQEEVRAPMPQRQEILVEGPDELAYSFRGRRRMARSVFDKFRDFEAETKRQEELLEETNDDDETKGIHKRKKRTLEDLFRPPLDIMFRGNFQAARDAAINAKKWLMVNIQNSSEFPCQVLNRDVWSSSAVKEVISEYFIFWQLYHDSEDGRRYMNYYPVNDWPYVSVIDPRTGECLVYWHKIETATFCDLAMEFLSTHMTFNEQLTSPQPKKRLKKSSSILEETEDAQIEAAIKASLERTPSVQDAVNGHSVPSPSSDSENDKESFLETFDSDSDEFDLSLDLTAKSESKESTESSKKEKHYKDVHADKQDSPTNEKQMESIPEWKKYLGLQSDPESKLILRLPDGSRDSIIMPCSSKLMALVKFVETKGFKNESYELVTNFPKRQLSYMDFNSTLKSVGLYPQESIFIQKR